MENYRTACMFFCYKRFLITDSQIIKVICFVCIIASVKKLKNHLSQRKYIYTSNNFKFYNKFFCVD